MILKGQVHKFGDDVNTDEIIPARYLNTTDPVELAKHCMEGIDRNFTKKVVTGDIIVAGKNFGCGSSREHASIAIKKAGISCVVASSFARIFFRNAINTGLPILEQKDLSQETKSGDKLVIDLDKGTIKNITKGKAYKTQPFPDFLQRIIEAGGLMESIKQEKKL